MNRGHLNIFKSLIWTPKNLPVSMWNTSCGVVHFTKYYSQKVDKKEKVYLKNKENLCKLPQNSVNIFLTNTFHSTKKGGSSNECDSCRYL